MRILRATVVGVVVAAIVGSLGPGALATGSWSVVPSPNGAGSTPATFSAISCALPSSCVAVGDLGGLEGQGQHALIERFDGTRWKREVAAEPSAASSVTLKAVSCPSTTFCVAVGSWHSSNDLHQQLAEVWTGSGWSIASTPAAPSPALTADFEGVTCTSPTDCTIVGESEDVFIDANALIEHWDGSTWTREVLATPSSVHSVFPASIACVSATSCKMVGEYQLADNSLAVFAASSSGTTWSVDTVPNPPGVINPSLTSVSCTGAPMRCVAVGYGSNGAVAARWNGSAWTLLTVPVPAGASSIQLRGVSCAAATDCIAVGYWSSATAGHALVERYDGTELSLFPAQPASSGALSGVTCRADDSCTVVGDASFHVFVAAWNGVAWVADAHANPITPVFSAFNGVACASATSCAAVGWSFTAHGDKVLVEHWNGIAWVQQGIDVPQGSSQLNNVACPSIARCVAVGDTASASGRTTPVAEIWSGGRWSFEQVPVAASATTKTLRAVTCVSTTDCIAVGATNGSSSGTLIERWNGTSWTTEPSPALPGKVSGELFGVVCTSAASCVASGSYATPSGSHTLVERSSGAAWSVVATPAVSQPVARLDAVTCTSAVRCIAVGSQESSASGTGEPLTEQWNGANWSVVADPGGLPASSALHAVACVSANDCVAVGTSGEALPVIEHWNGSAWTAQTAPMPAGDQLGELFGVACVSGRCTGVGGATVGPIFLLPLPNTFVIRSS